MLWTERHAPTDTTQLAGNKDAVSRARGWALHFSNNQIGKPLLLWGPSGCGKSALARALAAEMSWNLSIFGPPNKDEMERWERQLSASISGGGLFGSSSLILIEDVDDWSGARGGLSTLSALLKDARAPVILTSHEWYDRSIATLRASCEGVAMKSINAPDLISALERVAKAERLSASAEGLKLIASHANGDLRAAINDLQAFNGDASREREKNIFELVRACFKSPTYRSTRGLDLGPLFERDTLKLYVLENLPFELRDANDLACGFSRLSRADVFDGRIRTRQYWGFLRYSSDLMVWGVSSERRHPSVSFVPYAFPSYIQKMGATKSKRALNKALAAKIAVRTHTTTRTARVFIPLLQAQAAKKTEAKIESLDVLGEPVTAPAPDAGPNGPRPAPGPSEPGSGESQAPRPPPAPSIDAAVSLLLSPPLALQAYYSFDDDELAGLMGVAPDSLKAPAREKTASEPRSTAKKTKKSA